MSAQHHGGHRENSKPKLTDEQVLEILRRNEVEGQSCGKIERIMNLPHSLVRGVIYGGNGTKTVALAK